MENASQEKSFFLCIVSAIKVTCELRPLYLSAVRCSYVT